MLEYAHYDSGGNTGGTMDAQLLDGFYRYLVNHKNYTPTTAQSYRRFIEVFTTARHITELSGITPLVVDDYCDERIARGLRIDSNAVFMNAIRSFLRFCNRYYSTEYSIEAYEVPRRKGRRTDYLTAEEVMRMVDASHRERDRLMVLVAYTSGCRANELLQMTIENLRDSCWTCLVKGGKEHTYYFDPTVAERLRLFLYVCNIHEGAIWRTTTDRPITQSAYAMAVRTMAQKAGIKRPISTHKLRHGFATAMLENGTDIVTLAQMMGHNSIQTTQRYLHITDRRQMEHHQQFAPKVYNLGYPQFNPSNVNSLYENRQA